LYQSKEKGVKGKITDLKGEKNSSRPRPTATILSILWLRVEINGRGYENILPPGAGDLSINCRPEQCHPYQFEIPFDARRLQAGDNVIRITTISGQILF